MNDDEVLSIRANPGLGQYFLSSPEKLALVMAAAGIQPVDHVVEVGAGAGTVAQHVPHCASLTLVELDERLTRILSTRFPNARVLQGDALELLPSLACDVLLSNLPSAVTERLVELLPGLPCRTIVMAARDLNQVRHLSAMFDIASIAVLQPDDFQPRQPGTSELVRLRRIQ